MTDKGNVVNDVLGMYEMSPIAILDRFKFSETNVYNGNGMYAMKSLIGKLETSDKGKIMAIDQVPTVENVDNRQQLLLKRIGDLRRLLEAIKNLTVTKAPKIAHSAPSKMAISSPDFSQLGFTHDIVLNVNPLYPLHSLVGLRKIFDWFGKVNYTWHTHSSVRALPEGAKAFQEKLSGGNTQDKCPLNITFVWKDVSDCELILSPMKSVPILGEVNLVRFLSGLASGERDILAQAVADAKLDACHALLHRPEKEAQFILDEISQGLEKSVWLMGDNASYIDIAAWSTIKKMKKPSLKPKLSQWFNKCDVFINSS